MVDDDGPERPEPDRVALALYLAGAVFLIGAIACLVMMAANLGWLR